MRRERRSEEDKIRFLCVAAWNIVARFFAGGFILIGTCFTRLLTTEDYGRVAIYSAWLGILNLFIGLQTHGSIANASIKYDGKWIRISRQL